MKSAVVTRLFGGRRRSSRNAFTCFLVVFYLLLGSANTQAADENAQGRFLKRIADSQQATVQEFITIAGLKVAVWRPPTVKQPMPLVIFSHGFKGRNTQSRFLMLALTKAGYLVMAPDHDDATALGIQGTEPPEVPFHKATDWSETTYKKRGQDIQNLLTALHKDKDWNERIDWSKLALCGHSLGGYTVLGLAGAWPSWQIPNIKAVLALSPYCEPFIAHDTLSGIKIPVMYQGGTRDFGITPSVKRSNGAFAKTGTPSYFIEFDKMGHLGWTGFNQNTQQKELIDFYSIAFLDKYVKGDKSVRLDEKKEGVAELISK
jgi:predicted dienelactone hydrolase